ncbi:MAG: hypothetical protein ACD_12C00017G0001 [uncultured bacterium]|nr:MAG: hypothetical protein ACD_12C00017G0001 [uncultured bacterium]
MISSSPKIAWAFPPTSKTIPFFEIETIFASISFPFLSKAGLVFFISESMMFMVVFLAFVFFSSFIIKISPFFDSKINNIPNRKLIIKGILDIIKTLCYIIGCYGKYIASVLG